MELEVDKTQENLEVEQQQPIISNADQMRMRKLEEKVVDFVSKQRLPQAWQYINDIPKLYDITITAPELAGAPSGEANDPEAPNGQEAGQSPGTKNQRQHNLSNLKQWSYGRKIVKDSDELKHLDPIESTARNFVRFNGKTFEQITEEHPFLGLYQLVCKPRVFPNSAEIEDHESLIKEIQSEDMKQKLNQAQSVLLERITLKLQKQKQAAEAAVKKEDDIEEQQKQDQDEQMQVTDDVKEAQPGQLAHVFNTTEEDLINIETFENLKETLLCSVCADVYKDPMNVRQCLHKFCSQCIEDYNRIYKKECPACRTPIGSRRQLRRDFKIQLIIKSLITETAKFNEIEYRLRQQRLAKELSVKRNAYSIQMQKIFQRQKKIRKAYMDEEAQDKIEAQYSVDYAYQSEAAKRQAAESANKTGRGSVRGRTINRGAGKRGGYRVQNKGTTPRRPATWKARKQKRRSRRDGGGSGRRGDDSDEDMEDGSREKEEGSSDYSSEVHDESQASEADDGESAESDSNASSSNGDSAKASAEKPSSGGGCSVDDLNSLNLGQTQKEVHPDQKRGLSNKQTQQQCLQVLSDQYDEIKQKQMILINQLEEWKQKQKPMKKFEEKQGQLDKLTNKLQKIKLQKQQLKESLGYYQIEFDDVGSPFGQYSKYYVEFNIRQQKNFENCIIENQQVDKASMQIKCLSDIRVKDIRKFVYYQVKEAFSQLDPSNIELAYRRQVPPPAEVKEQWEAACKFVKLQANPAFRAPVLPIFYEYIPIRDEQITLSSMIETNKWWKREKSCISFKEQRGLPIGSPKDNETMFVRFVMSD